MYFVGLEAEPNRFKVLLLADLGLYFLLTLIFWKAILPWLYVILLKALMSLFDRMFIPFQFQLLKRSVYSGNLLGFFEFRIYLKGFNPLDCQWRPWASSIFFSLAALWTPGRHRNNFGTYSAYIEASSKENGNLLGCISVSEDVVEGHQGNSRKF